MVEVAVAQTPGFVNFRWEKTTDFMSVVLQFRPIGSHIFTCAFRVTWETTDFMSVVLQFRPTDSHIFTCAFRVT